MSEIKTNKISSLTSSNSDITLDPDGTGNLIVSSGNVGIGTTSPQEKIHFHKSDSGSSAAIFTNSTTGSGVNNGLFVGLGSDEVGYFYSYENNHLTFGNNNTERMRIATGVSGGQVRIGTFGAFGGGNAYLGVHVNSTTKAMVTETGDTSGRSHFSFRNGNGEVGGIDTGGSSTFFNTSSDYRLKENVADMTGAIDRVKALAPKRFNFIADDTVTVDGFLAHEAQAVVPEAVKGTHNEVDDDGNPVMQGIDQSKLVPLLTGALREAIAKIEALEARVTALENA